VRELGDRRLLRPPGDFHPSSSCPNPLAPPVDALLGTCTIDVAFQPTAIGQRSGTLSTGTTDITGLIPGPTVSLLGAGAAASGGFPSGTSGTEARRKKCRAHKKRPRVAQASRKKKCKKRRR
jgi:hypothetical protein